MGTTNSGWGVVGGAGANGIAVQGYAEGVNSVGVHAVHAGGGTALDINNGAIKVSGGFRSAFTWTAPTGGPCTILDHPLTNGDPNAILFVTFQAPVTGRLAYITVDQRWWVCAVDSFRDLLAGDKVNVLVIKQ